MPVEKSCGAVVFMENEETRYLLLHYEAGHWGFVKGKVEVGEREEETVRRELMEEAGICDADFVPGFREEISYFYKRRGETVYKEAIYLLVRAKTREVKLSYEHTGHEWLNYQEALERLPYKNTRNVLRKAHRFLENLVKQSEAPKS
ncbi:MAG: bis(5'-nucleosyl)-tetraphosphatase [Candidatus Bathyarchaeia archaeon]